MRAAAAVQPFNLLLPYGGITYCKQNGLVFLFVCFLFLYYGLIPCLLVSSSNCWLLFCLGFLFPSLKTQELVLV